MSAERPPARHYSFGPGVELRLTGTGAMAGHYDAEYGSPSDAPRGGDPDVDVVFGNPPTDFEEGGRIEGGHKTVRWRVSLGGRAEPPLHAHIALGGAPRSFALSLTQGYVVEPLLSIAAAFRGCVFVPAAALRRGEGAVLIMGRSGSGKTSLSARALSAGREVLGDDQVILDRSCALWPFPRRMRFYSDLPRTAPGAYRRLPRRLRAGLVARRVVRSLSRGFVAPPIRVPPALLGPAPAGGPLPLRSVALIDRRASVDEPRVERIEGGAAAGLAVELLDQQRAHLRELQSSAWSDALQRAHREEVEILTGCFEACSCERVTIPATWAAPRALDALMRHFSAPG